MYKISFMIFKVKNYLKNLFENSAESAQLIFFYINMNFNRGYYFCVINNFTK